MSAPRVPGGCPADDRLDRPDRAAGDRAGHRAAVTGSTRAPSVTSSTAGEPAGPPADPWCRGGSGSRAAPTWCPRAGPRSATAPCAPTRSCSWSPPAGSPGSTCRRAGRDQHRDRHRQQREVRRAYPGRITFSRNLYGTRQLTFTPAKGTGGVARIVFDIGGAKVTSFRAGRLLEVNRLEGYA